MKLADYSRFILSADQRERVADIVGSKDETLFLQIEEILADYTSHRKVLDVLPKAADTRDTFAAISKYAKEDRTHMLEKKINRLNRWAWIEYLFTHDPTEDLAELSEQAADMSRRYADRKTQRRTDQVSHARNFALNDLVDVFSEHYIEDAIPAEWLDTCEIFVAETLGFAGIRTPAASDPDMILQGEQYRGRLRRLIQSYLSSNPSH